jgi:hypothetical protein
MNDLFIGEVNQVPLRQNKVIGCAPFQDLFDEKQFAVK